MGDDPYLWHEDVEGESALAWVKRHSAPTVAAMAGDRFQKVRADALDIFDCDTRIPGLGRRHRRRRVGRRRGRELGVGRRWLRPSLLRRDRCRRRHDVQRGGSYAMANIRGGGEYAPAWHERAVRTNRHEVAEDFASIARHLVDTGVTTAARLGAMGGSAGGLLIGVMVTKYPELFGALVCQNPLLGMRRYHLVLITSSTNADRAHPGHARKMTAALEAAGHRVMHYENTEGGHSGASNNAEAAFERALRYEFLLQTLC